MFLQIPLFTVPYKKKQQHNQTDTPEWCVFEVSWEVYSLEQEGTASLEKLMLVLSLLCKQ